MDKNNITGLVLMAVVLFGFTYWSSQQAPQPTPSAPSDTTAVQAAAHPTVQATQQQDSTSTFFAAKTAGTQEAIVLTNKHLEVVINPKGGQIARANLTNFRSYADYKAQRQAPLALYNEQDAAMNFEFETKTANISTGDYYFVAENRTDSSVTMVLTDPSGARIAFDYRLSDDYMVYMDVRTEGMQQHFSPKTKTFLINWKDRVRQLEKGYYFENMYSTLTYKLTDNDAEQLSQQGDDTAQSEGSVDWIAFKNQYFSSCFIAKEPLTSSNFTSTQLEEGSGYLKSYAARAEAAFDPTGQKASSFQWYFGPNNFRLLQSMERHKLSDRNIDLQELVYLGWPIVRWINRFFTIYVFDFLTAAHLPMWLVLVLITLLLRVIVYAPTRKSFLSSAKSRALRPKVEALNAKYPNKEDALKKQQEVMSLYSKYGASPMGGCLPMLIQMPIWIAMFNFVPNAIEMRQQSFLWADDLSAYDSVISWSTNIWGLGNHLSLFCVLFCLSNVGYTWMTMRQQRDQMAAMGPEQAAQMKMMNWMMYAMPVMFFFMFNKYSSGLNFYYFISLATSALTMWYLRRTTDDAKLMAKMEAYYEKNKNNPSKQPSGMAAKFQSLMEQQQKLLEEQRKTNGRS